MRPNPTSASPEVDAQRFPSRENLVSTAAIIGQDRGDILLISAWIWQEEQQISSQGSASLMQPFLRLIGSQQVERSRRVLPSAFRTLKSSLVLNLHVVPPGSNAAAIDVRTELDTERYLAPQEPGFRHTYATYQDMVGRARTWVLGLKIRVLRRSVGSSPTAPTGNVPPKEHFFYRRQKAPASSRGFWHKWATLGKRP